MNPVISTPRGLVAFLSEAIRIRKLRVHKLLPFSGKVRKQSVRY